MAETTLQDRGPEQDLTLAFDQLLEITWNEHQALVAQLRRILDMERRLLNLCRCAGLDVPKDVSVPDLPEMESLESSDRSSTTLHGRWDGAFSQEP